VNSDYLNGLSVEEAKATVIGRLEADGHGTGTVQYKLRDWLFARQRNWGENIPCPRRRQSGGCQFRRDTVSRAR
ncbi:hypothetical protein, partial [Nocardia cyriacigeorgica]|uniref:hypothetical protein n=1 Tax=Nocardia cyriacigeorgica TaxID=135487 RepID=UPI002454870E